MMKTTFLTCTLVGLLSFTNIGCSDTDEGTKPDVPTGAAFPQASSHCVDKINEYRGMLGLTPYARWTDAEICSDGEAKSDSETGTAHGAFGTCGENAQNECPGWPGEPEQMIDGCLAQMWAEGPGADFSTHGHYINMSSMSYTKVACGFFKTADGSVWSVQNFQ